MVASKELLKVFEEGATLDLKSTGLSTSGGAVFRQLDNVLLENGYNLRGRRGVQMIGQPGGFVGTHRYTYLDRTTGAAVEEIVAINDHLWRLKTGTCVITQVGSTGALAWDYEILPNGSGVVELKIYEYPAGVKTLVYTESLGTGLEHPHLVKTIAHLQEDLETTTSGLGIGQGGAGYSFTGSGVLGQYAFIDNTAWTAMNGAPGKYAIEVDSSASDTTTMNWANFMPVWDYRHGRLLGLIAEGGASTSMGVTAQPPGTKEAGWVSGILAGTAESLSAKSLTSINGVAYTSTTITPTFTAGQVIGQGCVPAATIPFKASTDSGTTVGTFEIPVSYWDKAMGFGGERDLNFVSGQHTKTAYARSYRRDLRGPFFAAFLGRYGKNFRPPVFVDHKDVTYIFFTSEGVDDVELHENHVYKYDGVACYRAGMPRSYASSGVFTKAASSAGITGDVQFVAEIEFEDARGNIAKGNLPVVSESSPSNQRVFPTHSSLYVEEPEFVLPLAGGTNDTQFFINQVDSKVKVGQYVGFQSYLVRVTLVKSDNFIVEDITGSGYTWTTSEKIWINPAAGFRVSPLALRDTALSISYSHVSNAPMVREGEKVLGINPGFATAGGANSRYPVTREMALSSYDGTVSWFAATSSPEASVVFTPPHVDVDGSTLQNSAVIMVGVRTRLYRSFANGSLLYEATNLPTGIPWGSTSTGAFEISNSYLANAYAFSEDASLTGPELIEPDFGESRGLPPKASVGCTHQGVLVASGIMGEPNSVEFSSITQGPEAFSKESNQFDVPSTTGGTVTAVASDKDDRLAVLKERGYFDVAGSLPSLSFSVKSVRDGDYGVSSHNSLIKVAGTLIGVGPLGFVAIEGGQLIPAAEELSAEIINNRFLALNRARAVMNFKDRQYQCYIPGIDCDCPTSSRSAESDLCFVLDVSIPGKTSWRSYSYASNAEAFGGWSMFGGIPHHLHPPYKIGSSEYPLGAVFREIPERYQEQGIGSDNLPEVRPPWLFFADHVAPIPYRMRSQFIHMGEPNLPKTFQRFVLHHLYRLVEASKFVPWSCTLNLYRNFQESVVYASYDVEFPTVSTIQRIAPLKDQQANALAWEVIVNELWQAPHITGYTIMVAAPYKATDVKT